MLEKSQSYSTNCCICNEIISSQFPIEYRGLYPLENRVCLENDNFIVVPSISPIVNGHVLIFPKYHIKNLASIEITNHNSFSEIVSKTASFISQQFGDPFIFEHGVGEDGFTGCGIDHAHLHVIPLDDLVSKTIIKRVSDFLSIDQVGPLLKIFSNVDKAKSYLLFGSNIELMNFSSSNKIQSQFLRKLIAEELDNREWDWKKYYGRESFINTYNSFLAFNSSQFSY